MSPALPEEERLRLDYQQTLTYFQALSDVRFKLLAFVPTVSGTAVAVVPNLSSPAALALGLLGLVVPLAISMFELRNSLFYDAAIHRAKEIERRLQVAVYTRGAPPEDSLMSARALRSVADRRRGPSDEGYAYRARSAGPEAAGGGLGLAARGGKLSDGQPSPS